MINFLEVLKSLPTHNCENIGWAIDYGDIANALRLKGLDNKDIIDSKLKELCSTGLIEIFYQDDFAKDLINAVKVK